jgi:glycosyltransferase involved in cell wall biosynthesis
MTRPGDLFIMTNDGTHGDKVLQRLGVRDNRIRFWINGVSKYDCPPSSGKKELTQQLGLGIDMRILMTVSRLERLKRVDRAIRIMPKVLAQNVDVVLVVVGDGSERPVLQDLAEKLGVSEHVLFVGSIPHEMVREFMNGCDVFLSFYEHTNLCNPVLEALVCGKSVVTLDDGSTKGILENGHNAVLIEKDHLERNVPWAILRLLEDDDELHRLGENARLSAQRKLLSWDERIGIEMEELKALIGSYRKERRNKA